MDIGVVMNILITGGSGYLGSNLARELVLQGHEVCLLLRSSSNVENINDIIKKCKIKRFSENRELEDIFDSIRPSVVIHLACAYGRLEESSSEMISTNVILGTFILEICANLSKPVSFFNTDTCLAADVNSYSLSKTQFASWGRLVSSNRQNSLTFINIKLQQFYGPGDDISKLPGRVILSCLSNEDRLDLTSGNQLRDFIFIKDVIRAFDILLENLQIFDGYVELDLGSGFSITVREFVEKIHLFTKSSTELVFGSIEARDNEPVECVAVPKLLNSMGWYPQFSIDEGLNKTIEIERQNFNID